MEGEEAHKTFILSFLPQKDSRFESNPRKDVTGKWFVRVHVSRECAQSIIFYRGILTIAERND